MPPHDRVHVGHVAERRAESVGVVVTLFGEEGEEVVCAEEVEGFGWVGEFAAAHKPEDGDADDNLRVGARRGSVSRRGEGKREGRREKRAEGMGTQSEEANGKHTRVVRGKERKESGEREVRGDRREVRGERMTGKRCRWKRAGRSNEQEHDEVS